MCIALVVMVLHICFISGVSVFSTVILVKEQSWKYTLWCVFCVRETHQEILFKYYHLSLPSLHCLTHCRPFSLCIVLGVSFTYFVSEKPFMQPSSNYYPFQSLPSLHFLALSLPVYPSRCYYIRLGPG